MGLEDEYKPDDDEMRERRIQELDERSDAASVEQLGEAEILQKRMKQRLKDGSHVQYSGGQGTTYHNPTNTIMVPLKDVAESDQSRNKLVQIYMDETTQYLRSAFPKSSYSGHRVKQLMRWLSTAIQQKYTSGQEVQCYYLAAENRIIVGVNEDGLIPFISQELDDESLFDVLVKILFSGPPDILPETSGLNHYRRVMRHFKKLELLCGKLDEQPFVPQFGYPLLYVAPNVPGRPRMHAEAKIWYYLGMEPLDINLVGGIKPPCVACAVTIFNDVILNAITRNPTAFMRAGGLWNTKDAMQGPAAKLQKEGTSGLETRRAQIVEQMLQIPTTVRYSRTVDYQGDQSSDDEAGAADAHACVDGLAEAAKFEAAYKELKGEFGQMHMFPISNFENWPAGAKLGFVRGMRAVSIEESGDEKHISYLHRSGIRLDFENLQVLPSLMEFLNENLMIDFLFDNLGMLIPDKVWETYDKKKMEKLMGPMRPLTTAEEVESFINCALQNHCIIEY